jgi:protocatechuate 3,4-dioxygenase beta subunit
VTLGEVLRISFVMLVGWGAAMVQAPAMAQTKHDSAATRYEISGAVINTVNGNPVPHCHLTPSPTGPSVTGRAGFGGRQFPAPTGGFDCDSHGRFRVTVPSAGAWRLTASARGFVSQAYDEHEFFSSAIVLTAEAPTKDIEFRLGPEASIVGVVLDEAGEPVRNAQLTLQGVPRPAPGGRQPAGNARGGAAHTDDRGMYELPNLSPGEYRLSVRAQPWYAANLPGGRGNDSGAASLDPSLDFAYPATWFPGVSDPALAETIVLHAGDARQADFHLVPMPSIHMRILTPPRVSNGPNASPGQAFPIIQQVNSAGGGGPNFVQLSTRFDQQGQIDVGGLTPGLYQVRLAGPNQEGHIALVEVTANSARTLDLSTPSRDMARITLRLDGVADSEANSNSRAERNGGVQVTLIDTDTHRGSFSSNGNQGGGPNLGRRDPRDPGADRILEVPPGRYEVVLQGRPNIFLTGLTGKGAEVAGRYVTVGAGDSTLTVHAASGRASLSGVASLDGKPAVGAMVLLVPITIEDPNSITMLRQDQTNTDGSFEVANIIPGEYILIATDHGWQINWGDPSTLRRYLMQGVPVELKSSAIVKQNIAAQTP